MSDIIAKAYAHQGSSFVEIYQDCHVFNSGAFDAFSTKTERQDHVLYLEDEQNMVYQNGAKCLVLQNDQLQLSDSIANAVAHHPDQYQ